MKIKEDEKGHQARDGHLTSSGCHFVATRRQSCQWRECDLTTNEVQQPESGLAFLEKKSRQGVDETSLPAGFTTSTVKAQAEEVEVVGWESRPIGMAGSPHHHAARTCRAGTGQLSVKAGAEQ